MKRIRLVASLLVLGFMLMAVPAMAQTVNTYGGYGPYQTGLGGEFTLQVSNDLTWVLNGYASGKTSNVGQRINTFQSFCLEKSEYINRNAIYNVAISNSAKGGGVNGADPISIGTAWLYSQFATGNFAAYNYNAGRTTSAANLQDAFWMLEGEKTFNSGNQYISYLISNTQWKTEGALKADANGAYGVAVLNLGVVAGAGQDQLVMVPEPSILLLLGTCLVGVGVAVRRFKIQV